LAHAVEGWLQQLELGLALWSREFKLLSDSLCTEQISLSLSLSLPLSLYPSLFNGKSATVAPALTNNKLLA